MNMEIKIPKEVRQHSETIFFGLSTRQFICAVLAVSVAIGTYFLTKGAIGKETASWVCIVAAAPLAAAGFFRYNGLTFERFVWAAPVHAAPEGDLPLIGRAVRVF